MRSRFETCLVFGLKFLFGWLVPIRKDSQNRRPSVPVQRSLIASTAHQCLPCKPARQTTESEKEKSGDFFSAGQANALRGSCKHLQGEDSLWVPVTCQTGTHKEVVSVRSIIITYYCHEVLVANNLVSMIQMKNNKYRPCSDLRVLIQLLAVGSAKIDWYVGIVWATR